MELGRAGVYKVWRLNRSWLEVKGTDLPRHVVDPKWGIPNRSASDGRAPMAGCICQSLNECGCVV